jgi:hypothetical protein
MTLPERIGLESLATILFHINGSPVPGLNNTNQKYRRPLV